MANIFVSAIATFNGKALAKGKKEISAFDKQVNKLGKTFASVFGATALLRFGKQAVAAFAADEKAAKALETQLKNTGFAFATPSVEFFIANLQKTTGVLDDELRPAFQQLLTVTGSITKSQDALSTALNVSAATGRSLTEVSAALTRGFSGNTAGLSRLGAGISKTTLKTGDMDKILGELNKKFAGQFAARLETYAGKMSLLNVAAEDAKETIGKGLVDALVNLTKDKSIENLTNDIDNLATGIANVITGVGNLAKILSDLKNTPGIKQLIDILTFGNLLNNLKFLGATSQTKPTSNFTYSLGASAMLDVERANEAKRLKATNLARKNELALLNAKNKKQTEVDKLAEQFDIERIGLMKALNETTDAETKLRLQAKIAILDNNEALAKKLAAEMEAARKAAELAEAARKAAEALAAAGKAAQVFAMGAVQRGEYGARPLTAPSVPSLPTFEPLPTFVSAPVMMGAVQRGEHIVVNVAGSVLTDQDLTDTIQRTILQINKQGRGTTPAGGLSGGT